MSLVFLFLNTVKFDINVCIQYLFNINLLLIYNCNSKIQSKNNNLTTKMIFIFKIVNYDIHAHSIFCPFVNLYF